MLIKKFEVREPKLYSRRSRSTVSLVTDVRSMKAKKGATQMVVKAASAFSAPRTSVQDEAGKLQRRLLGSIVRVKPAGQRSDFEEHWFY